MSHIESAQPATVAVRVEVTSPAAAPSQRAAGLVVVYVGRSLLLLVGIIFYTVAKLCEVLHPLCTAAGDAAFDGAGLELRDHG